MPSGKPQVIVRVTQSQKENWEDAARLNRMTLAAFIRRAVDLAVGSEVVAPVIRPELAERGIEGEAATLPKSADRPRSASSVPLPAESSAQAAETAAKLIRTPADVPAAIAGLEREFKPDFKAPAEKKKGRQ